MDKTGIIISSEAGWRHEVVSHDIDEFACAQPSWSLHYEQLSTGSFVGKLQHLQLPGMTLTRCTPEGAPLFLVE